MLGPQKSQYQNFLEKIFYSGNKNRFRNKAGRYQYIIKFFLTDTARSFKITEIQDGVLNEASYIFDIDTTKNPSEIKKNQNRQFNEILKELEKWKIIISTPTKSERGGVNTNEYSLTNLGITIGLIIEYILSEDKKSIFNKLFEHWKTYLLDYSTSLDLFCLSYISKCQESGLFNRFAEYFIKNVINVDSPIQNNNDLFTQMVLSRFENNNSENEKLWDLWNESLVNLKSIRSHYIDLFFNHLSIHIDRIIINKIHNYSKYEVVRYENRKKYDSITLEGTCRKCRDKYSIFQFVYLYMWDFCLIIHLIP